MEVSLFINEFGDHSISFDETVGKLAGTGRRIAGPKITLAKHLFSKTLLHSDLLAIRDMINRELEQS